MVNRSIEQKMPDRTKQFYVDDEEVPMAFSDEKGGLYVQERNDIQEGNKNSQEGIHTFCRGQMYCTINEGTTMWIGRSF